MIYTLTIAPALDYSLKLENKELRTGCTNRPKANKEMTLGGKGLIVSMMLNNLKVKSVPIVAVGGDIGESMKEKIDNIFDDAIYLPCEGTSRVDVIILGADRDTRFNPDAPKIKEKGLKKLFSFLKKNLNEDDILVLSGSTGQESDDIYAKLIDECANPKGVKVILDSVGPAFVNALKYHPFMIKPNDEELGDLLGKEMTSEEDIIEGGLELLKDGPQTVLVTMGSKGAIYFAEDGHIYRCHNAVGEQISAVGAGDSSISGFIKGLVEGVSIQRRLKYSMAAGGATAFSVGFGSYTLWKKLVPQIKIDVIR